MNQLFSVLDQQRRLNAECVRTGGIPWLPISEIVFLHPIDSEDFSGLADALSADRCGTDSLRVLEISSTKAAESSSFSRIMRALIRSDALKRLELSLDCGPWMLREVMRFVKASSTLTRLRLVLDLVSDEQARVFQDSILENTSIALLKLSVGCESNMRLSTALAAIVRRNAAPHLTTLNLKRCSFSIQETNVLCEALAANTSVQCFKLSLDGIDALCALATMLRRNTGIQKLVIEEADFFYNKWHDGYDDIVTVIAEDAPPVKTLFDALCVNRTIRTVKVRGYFMGDEGMVALAQLLRVNSTIEIMNICDLYFGGKEDSREVNEVLKNGENTNLRMLYWKCNDDGTAETDMNVTVILDIAQKRKSGRL
jgi:hypothetical protein